MITDWMQRARCAELEMDREMFFDLYLENDDVAGEVTKTCFMCPVRKQCYNYGVQTKSTGVWGGHWLQNGKVIKNKEVMQANYFKEI